MIKKLLLFAAALILSSCASSGPGKGVGTPSIKPTYSVKPSGKTVYESMEQLRELFGDKGSIVGKTLDLQGGEINGSKMKQLQDTQDEANQAIKLKIPGLTIKNGYFTKIPGGVMAMEEDITFQNIVATQIGEESISNVKDISDRTKVINCKFYGNDKNDKLLQLNNSIGAEVKGNLLAGGITAVRLTESTSKRQNGKPRVENNTFRNVDTALNVAGKTTVYLKNNTFEGVREKYHTSYSTVKFIEE